MFNKISIDTMYFLMDFISQNAFDFKIENNNKISFNISDYFININNMHWVDYITKLVMRDGLSISTKTIYIGKNNARKIILELF